MAKGTEVTEKPPALRAEERGSLEERALPDLLYSVCGRQETGVLHLIRHGVIKSIYIDHGRIVFANSTDRDDRLGELLLRRGLLRVQELDNALACLTPKKRLGGVLVEMGYLKPEALVQTIVDQVREIVFGLFLWTDGEYRLEIGDLLTREVITLRLSTPEVILGGIGRIDRWWRILSALGSLDAVFRTCPGRDNLLKQLRLNEPQAQILDVLQEPTTVRDLCGLGILPDFEACRTLWAYRVIGLVEPTDEAPTRPHLARAGDETTVVHEDDATLDEALERAVISGRPPEEPGAAAGEPEAPARESAGDGAQGHEGPILSSGVVGLADPAAEIPPAPHLAAPASPPRPAPAPASRPPAAPPRPAAATSKPAPPAPAAPAPPPKLADEAEVDAELASFNDRQRRLHGLLHARMGSQAEEVVARTLKGVSKELPALFKDVAGEADGVLKPHPLKDNLARSHMNAGGLAAALDLLVERELEAVAGLLGLAVRREIAAALKD